jgi:hypothetical protein
VQPSRGRADSPSTTTLQFTDVWRIEDVEAAFPDGFSLDSTQAGANATRYVAPGDDVSGGLSYVDEVIECHDHFRPIDLDWDGGYGLMRFHLDPPLLLVGFRPGTFKALGLVYKKAVYETLPTAESETTDPAGNVWRFSGRFNALCRAGEFDFGPLVFGGQVVKSQNPVTIPRLVRRGSPGGEGCGTGGGGDITISSYNPYASAPAEGDVSTTCSGGGGDASDGGSGLSCTWEYLTIEITRDGVTWETFWEGWGQVCDEASE